MCGRCEDLSVQSLDYTRGAVGAAVCVLLLSCVATPSVAATLRLPPSLRRAPAAITAQCPACSTTGFVACGTADVAYGKRFARTALHGHPPRGYLVTFVMSGGEFRALARRSSYDTLVSFLRDRFAVTRLVVLEPPAARVLGAPSSVDVTFPRSLHECVYDSDIPWGCCVGADCHRECCEKGLGSPSVLLTWTDPRTRESIRFRFHHMIGFARLERTGGRRQTLYHCLTQEAAWFAR